MDNPHNLERYGPGMNRMLEISLHYYSQRKLYYPKHRSNMKEGQRDSTKPK